MSKKSKCFVSSCTVLFLVLFSFQAAFASTAVLKVGMQGDSVTALQKDLKTLGFMSIGPTGYFGEITENAVVKLQKKYGLTPDGAAGAQTLGKINSLLGRTKSTASTASTASTMSAKVSRGEEERIGAKIVTFAKNYLGVRYVWGGSSPKGFDCSGFVKYVYGNFGIDLDRVAAAQARQGTSVKRADLQTGDLVFFDTNGGHNAVNHVGIYIGGGMFIQSSSAKSHVIISDMSEGFYSTAYMTARRFF